MFLSFFTNWLIPIPRIPICPQTLQLAFAPIHSSCFTTLQEVFFLLCKSNCFIGVLDSTPIHFLRNLILLPLLSAIPSISLSSGFFILAFKHVQDLPIIKNFPPHLYLLPTTTISFLFFIAQLLRFFLCLLYHFSHFLIHSSTHSNLDTVQKLHCVTNGFHAANSNGHFSTFNLLDTDCSSP